MIIALTLSLVKTGKKNAVVALEFSVLEKSGSKARAHGDRVKPGFTTGLGNQRISQLRSQETQWRILWLP